MNEAERLPVFSLAIWNASFVKALVRSLAHSQLGYLFLVVLREFSTYQGHRPLSVEYLMAPTPHVEASSLLDAVSWSEVLILA